MYIRNYGVPIGTLGIANVCDKPKINAYNPETDTYTRLLTPCNSLVGSFLFKIDLNVFTC